jgi:phospholipid/cholesterol/gamma-HCH transport system substrate-binding protein
MDERVVQFRVGVMVVATLLITGILVVLFGEVPGFVGRIFHRTYTVQIWFPEGRGLTVDSLVRRNGIVIGRVTGIRFAGEVEGMAPPKGVSPAQFANGILVTAEIQKDVKLYEHDVCRIETDLLGKPSLEFALAEGKAPSTELLDTAQLQKGEVAPNPLDSVSAVTQALSQLTPNVSAASQAIASAGNSMNEAAQKVNALLDEHTQEQIRSAITRSNQALGSIQKIIGNEESQERLQAALKELPGTLAQFKVTMAKAQARLDEVARFTQKLGSQQTVDRLDQATKDLQQVMADLKVLSGAVSNPQGSLGLLLRDRQLYDHLNCAAQNIDRLSRELQPILGDVRVFTDKVARHPERLGARGLVERYPGIK